MAKLLQPPLAAKRRALILVQNFKEADTIPPCRGVRAVARDIDVRCSFISPLAAAMLCLFLF